jgi:hypothetical protein
MHNKIFPNYVDKLAYEIVDIKTRHERFESCDHGSPTIYNFFIYKFDKIFKNKRTIIYRYSSID